MNSQSENYLNTEADKTASQASDRPLSNRLPIPLWRLLVPLLFQAALILSIPAQPFYTRVTGRTVILQTLPVDPYDLLRGYSQTLNYDISVREILQELPGWQEVIATGNSTVETSFYAILERPAAEASGTGVPKAWVPVAVSRDRPANLADNQVALKGQLRRYGRIQYGLETYYMPEDQRDRINQDISQTRLRREESFVVEIKVDSRGHAVPLSLWVGDRNYRF